MFFRQKQKLPDDWHLVCKSTELKNKPLAKTINGIPLVLFRDNNGKAGVLLDRCPHRTIPMSRGYIENGNLVCKHHGWHFNTEGTCVKVPQLKELSGDNERDAVCFNSVEHEGNIYVFSNATARDFPQIKERPFGLHSPIPKITDIKFLFFIIKILIFFIILGAAIYFWFQMVPGWLFSKPDTFL